MEAVLNTVFPTYNEYSKKVALYWSFGTFFNFLRERTVTVTVIIPKSSLLMKHPAFNMVTQNCNIRELGRRVASLSEAVSDLYVVTNNSEPDFGSNSAENLETPDYIKLRALLNDTANDLILLVNGPRQTIRSFGVTHFDLAAFQTALEFNFFEAIPLNHTINLEELSEKVELKKEYVSRVLRILATRRMFVEIENDKFSHTSLSSLLARDEGIRAAAHMELVPALNFLV